MFYSKSEAHANDSLQINLPQDIETLGYFENKPRNIRKCIHTPFTLRQPTRQRTTNATETNMQTQEVNTCVGTTCRMRRL